MRKSRPLSGAFAVEYAGISSDLTAQTPYDQASKVCGELYEFAVKSGDIKAAARAARAQAEGFRRTGRVSEALAGFTTAARLFHSLNDTSEYAWTLWFRSNLKRQKGDFTGSSSDLRRAQVVSYGLKDAGLSAYLMAGMAEDTRIRGHYFAAEQQHVDALEAFKDMGDVRGVVWAVQGIAQIRKNQGRLREACGLFETSCNLASRIQDNRALGWGLRGMGEIYFEGADFERAANFLRSSVRSFDSAKCVVGAGFSNLTLGKLLARIGKPEEAASSLLHSRSLFLEAGDKRGLAFVTSALGHIHGNEGYRDIAIESSRLSLRWFWEKGVRYGMVQDSTHLMSLGISPVTEFRNRHEKSDVLTYSLQAYTARG